MFAYYATTQPEFETGKLQLLDVIKAVVFKIISKYIYLFNKPMPTHG